MKALYRDAEIKFAYDTVYSTVEGRFVTNWEHAHPGEEISIVIPSGTAGFEVWINNSAPFSRYAQDPSVTHLQPTDTFQSLSSHNVSTASFTGNWVNITSARNVIQFDKGFFITGGIRYIRLQGGSVTGSASAACGYMFSNAYFSQ